MSTYEANSAFYSNNRMNDSTNERTNKRREGLHVCKLAVHYVDYGNIANKANK